MHLNQLGGHFIQRIDRKKYRWHHGNKHSFLLGMKITTLSPLTYRFCLYVISGTNIGFTRFYWTHSLQRNQLLCENAMTFCILNEKSCKSNANNCNECSIYSDPFTRSNAIDSGANSFLQFAL